MFISTQAQEAFFPKPDQESLSPRVRKLLSRLSTLTKRLLIQSKNFVSQISIVGSSDSYEQWRQLEYRNEMATRMGERNNYMSIR